MKNGAVLPKGTRSPEPEAGSDINHPFLAGMEPERATRLVDRAEIVHFEPGEVIFREGEPADRFFLIQSGCVVLESHANPRGVVQIDSVRAGDVCGWSWLFPPFAWHFTARVTEPTCAIVCNGGRLLVMCEDDPEFGYDLMKRIVQVLIHRLQSARKQLGGIAGMLNSPPLPAMADLGDLI